MRILSISGTDYRSFEHFHLDFADITVLTGANNSGKSSLLRSILPIQQGHEAVPADVRVGKNTSSILVSALNVKNIQGPHIADTSQLDFSINIHTDGYRSTIDSRLSTENQGLRLELRKFPNREPLNPLIPFLSRRKASTYSENVSIQNAQTVSEMTFLAAKLARITNIGFPGYQKYKTSCEAILGFTLTAVPSANGQTPGIYLPDEHVLTLTEMAEGVPNIAALLIELATAKEKVFVIEEPENDLHPQSLKSLLDLILASSTENQFIISTHSNIVLQYLGAAPNVIYNVNKIDHLPPTSVVKKVENTPHARLKVLSELGYALSDFDLWDGWLILEESSAERIIRDFLIPFFSPKLRNMRTIATNGVNSTEATFNDFHRLVRFTHLEEIYRNTTWVQVDGDDIGKEVISKLRQKYVSWHPDRFGYFSKPQFEQYYPDDFADEVEAIFRLKDKQERRQAKSDLLKVVVDWLKADDARAKAALSTSVEEVINFLKRIEAQMLP